MAAAPEDLPLDPAALIRIGTVVRVDQAAATCIVAYGDPDGEEVDSLPLRWLVGRMGETGILSSPSVGEQGVFLSPEGDIARAIFFPGITRDIFPPVGNSAEDVIKFKDGARIAYDTEGHALTATLPAGSTADITADQLNINGNVSINGNLAIDGEDTLTGTQNADAAAIGRGQV